MIVLVGVSHHTAPIELRERLALDLDASATLVREIRVPPIREIVLLSTCNRVEILAGVDDAASSDAVRRIRDALRARAPGVDGALYDHQGDRVVEHLVRVASSLDSLIVGEPQILGQVKDAFELARGAGTVGAELSRLSTHVLRAAKRVRSETAIGSGQVSIPSVAVDLAHQIFGSLDGRRAALIGAGAMAETAAKGLGRAGAKLTILGRNAERAREVAAAVGGAPARWEDIPATLAEVDVVITATSAPGFVVSHSLAAEARKKRRGRSLFFVDLAVPRDVEPSVGDLDGVFLYNVDDLAGVVEGSLASRGAEAERAMEIVGEEVARWVQWRDAEAVKPVIVRLRERFRRMLDAEIEKSLSTRLKHLGSEERDALAKMAEAALNKILHEPTSKLRSIASDPTQRGDGLPALIAAINDLFALEAEVVTEEATVTETAESADAGEAATGERAESALGLK